MTVSIPDALRAIAWLLVPRHFLAIYTEQALVHVLALVALAVLARRVLRRYRRALAALLLSTTLLTAAAPARQLAALRPPFAQRRVVHAAHAPRRVVHAAHAPRRVVHAAHAPRRPVKSAAVAGQTGPQAQASGTTVVASAQTAGPGAAAQAAQMPKRPVPRQAARTLSEAQLLAIANERVIGPLIEACRQAAGGNR